MTGDDLSSISGMEDKHRRALARRQITTLRGLADADRHVIYRAMGSIKPRPTLGQIARWQDEARGRLDRARDRDQAGGGDQARDGDQARGGDQARDGDQAGGGDAARDRPGEAAGDTKEWQPVASFAVVFARRRAGETWERQIAAERTEVEPERGPEVWPGWECDPICGWMLGQVGQADGAEPGQPDRAGQALPAGAETSGPAGAARPPGRRPQLRIGSATIIDAAGRTEVVTGGAPAGELVAPARVVFTVTGARPGREVRAVARLRGPGRAGRNVGDPVAVPPSGRAEFDLSQVPAGQFEMRLLAWVPDGSAGPVSVRLPAMTIGPAADPA